MFQKFNFARKWSIMFVLSLYEGVGCLNGLLASFKSAGTIE